MFDLTPKPLPCSIFNAEQTYPDVKLDKSVPEDLISLDKLKVEALKIEKHLSYVREDMPTPVLSDRNNKESEMIKALKEYVDGKELSYFNDDQEVQ
jgi:hypothetical protein